MERRDIEQATKAFKEGLIFAYDHMEANIESEVFEENEEAGKLCKDQIRKDFFAIEEDPPLTEEEFEEFMESLMFYIYTGENQAKNISEAIKLTQGESFWGPVYVWIKGEMFDTYNLPATDEDGNITGVRF